MRNVKRDVRGFTLVELLAVIVVLAIIMLIAVNAVLPRMNSARKQAFAVEANALMEAAQTYIVNTSLNNLNGNAEPICVSVDTLRSQGYSEVGTKYSGKVLITKGTGSTYYYSVYLENDQFMVLGKGMEGSGETLTSVVISEELVSDYTTSGQEPWETSYASCE